MSDGLGGRPNLAALTDLYSLVCPHKYLDETVKIGTFTILCNFCNISNFLKYLTIPLTLLTQSTDIVDMDCIKKMLIFWKLLKCQRVPESLCLHFRAI